MHARSNRNPCSTAASPPHTLSTAHNRCIDQQAHLSGCLGPEHRPSCKRTGQLAVGTQQKPSCGAVVHTHSTEQARTHHIEGETALQRVQLLQVAARHTEATRQVTEFPWKRRYHRDKPQSTHAKATIADAAQLQRRNTGVTVRWRCWRPRIERSTTQPWTAVQSTRANSASYGQPQPTQDGAHEKLHGSPASSHATALRPRAKRERSDKGGIASNQHTMASKEAHCTAPTQRYTHATLTAPYVLRMYGSSAAT